MPGSSSRNPVAPGLTYTPPDGERISPMYVAHARDEDGDGNLHVQSNDILLEVKDLLAYTTTGNPIPFGTFQELFPNTLGSQVYSGTLEEIRFRVRVWPRMDLDNVGADTVQLYIEAGAAHVVEVDIENAGTMDAKTVGKYPPVVEIHRRGTMGTHTIGADFLAWAGGETHGARFVIEVWKLPRVSTKIADKTS